MAEVPYSGVPSVAPDSRPPEDYQRIDAKPEQFGAAIGRGLQGLGQGVANAGENVFDISKFQGKVNTDDQVNHFVTTHNDRLYGNPNKPATGADGQPLLGADGKPQPDTGYMGLEGRAALDQRAGLLKQLEEDRKAGLANLNSPQEKLEYDAQTRRMLNETEAKIGAHADAQWKNWAGGVNDHGAGLALNGFVNNLNDAKTMANHASDYINFKVQGAQIKFGDDPTIKAQAVADAKRDLLKAQTDRVAVTDPASALRILDKNKEIAGTQYDDMYGKLRARATQQTAYSVASQNITLAHQGTLSSPIQNAVAQGAQETGVPAQTIARTVQIESGGNPRAVTGSYKGLMQQSDSEWRKYSPVPWKDIREATLKEQIIAGARQMKAESTAFEQRTGRATSAFDSYMIHQQGLAGYAAHVSNPNAPAWQNMAATGEGRQKGEAWAKQAIWGNIPDQYKAKFGSVDNVTSRDFINMWAAKWGGGAQASFDPSALPRPGTVGGTLPQLVHEAAITPPFADMPAATPVAFTNRGGFNQQPGIEPPTQAGTVRQSAMDLILNDPRAKEDPQVMAESLRAAAQLLNAQEIAENQNAKAKKEASDGAANEHLTKLYDMEHSPHQPYDYVALAGQINHDQRLTWEAKRSLMEMVKHASGEEQSLGFGPAYYDAYKRIVLPPDDPDRINDVNDILKLGGPEGRLTPAGADRLVKVLNTSRKDPDQAAVNTTKSSLMQYERSKLTFDQEPMWPGGPVKRDEKGIQAFHAQFVPKVEAAYDAWIKAGKNPWEFLTKDNFDKLAAGIRSKAEMEAERLAAGGEVNAQKDDAGAVKLPPTPDGLRPEGWVPLMNRPPLSASGKPWPADDWGRSLRYLVDNPTPDVKAHFQKTYGLDPDKVIDSLHGKLDEPVAAPAAFQRPAIPAAPSAPHTYAERLEALHQERDPAVQAARKAEHEAATEKQRLADEAATVDLAKHLRERRAEWTGAFAKGPQGEALAGQKQRQHEANVSALEDLDRQEYFLEKSGLGVAFKAAQLRSINERREKLRQDIAK